MESLLGIIFYILQYVGFYDKLMTILGQSNDFSPQTNDWTNDSLSETSRFWFTCWINFHTHNFANIPQKSNYFHAFCFVKYLIFWCYELFNINLKWKKYICYNVIFESWK